MGFFEIPAGVQVEVYRPNVTPSDIQFADAEPVDHITTESSILGKEDVVLWRGNEGCFQRTINDPNGRLGWGMLSKRATIRGSRMSEYGFKMSSPGSSWNGATIIVGAYQLKYNGEWLIEDSDRSCRRCGFRMCSDGCCCGC